MEEELPYKLIRSNIKNVYIQIKDGEVIVKVPKRFSEKQIKTILKEKKKWIERSLQKEKHKQEKEEQYTKEEFIQIIQENVKELMKITELRPNRVRVKEIKYAWGSCSSNKNITINSKLIKYSKDAIRYVILHELCHIRYMNHSKDFWDLVAKYMPNYKEIKKELKS